MQNMLFKGCKAPCKLLDLKPISTKKKYRISVLRSRAQNRFWFLTSKGRKQTYYLTGHKIDLLHNAKISGKKILGICHIWNFQKAIRFLP